MKLGHFYYKEENEFFYGIVEEEKVYKIDDLFSRELKEEFEINKLEILPPVIPTKIVAIGLNYKDHAEEMKMKLPEEPLIFLKPPSSILKHKGKIIYPDCSERVDYEAELAVVIKKVTKNISKEEAKDFILGYTAFNDVTARDLQKKDGQWARAKGFDTFSPVGPFIETELDVSSLKIQAILNGEVKQDSNTSNMIFDVFDIVSYVSKIMTLFPGDIIATGTPSRIGPMQRGDKIVIKIEGMSELENYIA
ncbi:MAG: fumarylacetoacetate hydrolase family protein [Brevinematales bacterium]|nr:fumarylacetoacetate hydrolase family protein [Brevinematales bacterium]